MHIADTALMDVALGSASPEDSTAARAHVSGCESCSALLRNYETAVSRMREAAVTRAVVDRAWDRTAALVEGPGRFEVFAPELAEWLDIGEAEAKLFLRTVDDASLLTADCAPGVKARTVPHGPKRAGARVTFVRAAGRAVVPEHAHRGPEHAFIIQGGFTTDDGRPELLRGQKATYQAGTKHTVTALDGPDCYCFVINEAS